MIKTPTDFNRGKNCFGTEVKKQDRAPYLPSLLWGSPVLLTFATPLGKKGKDRDLFKMVRCQRSSRSPHTAMHGTRSISCLRQLMGSFPGRETSQFLLAPRPDLPGAQ